MSWLESRPMGWLESRPALLAIQLLLLLQVPELEASSHRQTWSVGNGTAHCPGPDWVSWQATCYLFGKEPKTRGDALKACHKESKLSSLLVIRSRTEQNFINKIISKVGVKREFWIGLKKGDGELSWNVSGKKEKGGIWKSSPNYIFGCPIIMITLANAYNLNLNLSECQKECFVRRKTFNCSVIEHVSKDAKKWLGGVYKWNSYCRLKACGYDPKPTFVPDRTGWQWREVQVQENRWQPGEKIKGWSLVPTAFENWGDLEPSNTQGKNCVKMKRGGGEQGPKGHVMDIKYGTYTFSKWPMDWYWMQEQCNVKHLYICERVINFKPKPPNPCRCNGSYVDPDALGNCGKIDQTGKIGCYISRPFSCRDVTYMTPAKYRLFSYDPCEGHWRNHSSSVFRDSTCKKVGSQRLGLLACQRKCLADNTSTCNAVNWKGPQDHSGWERCVLWACPMAPPATDGKSRDFTGYSYVRGPANFSARSCTCRDFVDSGGFGNCDKKSSNSVSGKPLPVCYVKSPSSCTDLKNADQDVKPMKWQGYSVSMTGRDDYLMSFEACKEPEPETTPQPINGAEQSRHLLVVAISLFKLMALINT